MQDTLPRSPSSPTAPPTNARAAVLVDPGRIEVRDVPLPDPGPGQVRLRLEGCGVCASNVPPWEGRPWFDYPYEPGTPGHEGWGVVDALGPDVTGVDEGDRVAAITYHAYATHDLADASNLVTIPNELSNQPFPGEPLGCAVNIFRRSRIEAGQTVAIVGIGFLGALLTQFAKAEGAHVIALSRRAFSLDVARTAGADETIQLQEDRGPLVEQVFELTDGEGCEVVIEATGKQAPLDLAAELTRVRGRLVVAGYHQDGTREVNMQLWNWRGLDVINAHERDPAVYTDGMRRAAAAVAAGRIDPDPLYTHSLPLDELGEALEMARTRPDGFLKALVRMD
jgi:threonine dehydrogenase-like Zn-dependent dehydrogenase